MRRSVTHAATLSGYGGGRMKMRCRKPASIALPTVSPVGIRPQSTNDRAGLGEASERVGRIVEGQAVRGVLAPGQRVVRS
jgi:hypothetical protein